MQEDGNHPDLSRRVLLSGAFVLAVGLALSVNSLSPAYADDFLGACNA